MFRVRIASAGDVRERDAGGDQRREQAERGGAGRDRRRRACTGIVERDAGEPVGDAVDGHGDDRPRRRASATRTVGSISSAIMRIAWPVVPPSSRIVASSARARPWPSPRC